MTTKPAVKKPRAKPVRTPRTVQCCPCHIAPAPVARVEYRPCDNPACDCHVRAAAAAAAAAVEAVAVPAVEVVATVAPVVVIPPATPVEKAKGQKFLNASIKVYFYALDRLTEGSTLRGIVMAAMSFGMFIKPEHIEAILMIGTAVVGLLGVLTPASWRKREIDIQKEAAAEIGSK